jgi:hypothetical protein
MEHAAQDAANALTYFGENLKHPEALIPFNGAVTCCCYLSYWHPPLAALSLDTIQL